MSPSREKLFAPQSKSLTWKLNNPITQKSGQQNAFSHLGEGQTDMPINYLNLGEVSTVLPKNRQNRGDGDSNPSPVSPRGRRHSLSNLHIALESQ
jgi:hypothetical protein